MQKRWKSKQKNCYNLGVNKCMFDDHLIIIVYWYSLFASCFLLFIYWLCIRFVSFRFDSFLLPFIWNLRNYSTTKCRISTFIPKILVYFDCTFFGAFQWFPAISLSVSRHKFICLRNSNVYSVLLFPLPFSLSIILMWQWNRKEKCEEKWTHREQKKKKTPQNHLNISANGKKPNFYLYFPSQPHFLSAVFSSCPSFVRILTFNHIFLLVEWKKRAHARSHAIRHLNNESKGENKKKRKWFESHFFVLPGFFAVVIVVVITSFLFSFR